MSRLILASGSPRRRDILSTLGLEFEVAPTDVDEQSLPYEDADSFVRAAALAKLERALEIGGPARAPVLAADTMVFVDDRRLGKPTDDDDALRMLRVLRGRRHDVRTAVAIGRVGQGVLDCRVATTSVWFREASDGELARYVATGEGRDKAGAYGIQGLAGGFVVKIDGSYTNVVGLPSAMVIEMLREQGALERWP